MRACDEKCVRAESKGDFHQIVINSKEDQLGS